MGTAVSNLSSQKQTAQCTITQWYIGTHLFLRRYYVHTVSINSFPRIWKPTMIFASAVIFWVTPSELIIKGVFMYEMKLVRSQRNSYQNLFAAMCVMMCYSKITSPALPFMCHPNSRGHSFQRQWIQTRSLQTHRVKIVVYRVILYWKWKDKAIPMYWEAGN